MLPREEIQGDGTHQDDADKRAGLVEAEDYKPSYERAFQFDGNAPELVAVVNVAGPGVRVQLTVESVFG